MYKRKNLCFFDVCGKIRRVSQFLWGSCLAFLSTASVADALSLTNLINQSDEVSPGGNWYWSDWFGYFKNLGANFVRHNEHGVLYFSDRTGNGYIYFDRSTGFWFYMEEPTVLDEFLYVYRFGDNQWWKYEKGTSPNRKFINDSTSVTQYWYVHLESTADGPNGPLPLWWKRSGMLNLAKPVSNNSPVNIAQLKHVVNETRKYLEDRLGISSALWDIAYSSYGGNPFPLSGGTPEDNLRPANLAQLKYLASGIYHVLNYTEGYNIAAHLSAMGTPSYEFPAFPWLSQTPVEENLVPLNIGQLKLVFSFSLDETPFAFVDLDEDGMNDAWELGIVAAKSQYNSIYDVYPHVDDTGNGLNNLQESTIVSRVIFRGDTNRDSVVDADDEEGKATWTKGPQGKGVIVLPNCDDDEGNGIPDNWIGGDWDWERNVWVPSIEDYYYGDEEPDNIVNADPDKDDLASLYTAKLGLDPLPSELSVTISINKPSQEHAFFTDVPAKKRIRIFRPTDVSGNDHLIKAGDPAMLHPGVSSESYTFSGTDLALFTGEGFVKLGVEGIEMGAEVDIVFTVKYNSYTLATETVRIRVAPFILSDHTMSVKRSGTPSQVVFVADTSDLNDPAQEEERLYNLLMEEYNEPGIERLIADSNYNWDKWHQDGYEVGYTKSPYGSMAIVLVLPRARRDDNGLRRFAHQKLLASGRGVYSKLPYLSEDITQMGGDLESVPGLNMPGKMLHGSSFSDPDLLEFFDAQGVNDQVAVDTSWLGVGHIDEVISRLPDGYRVLVADPEVAWALLLWANSISPNTEMLIGMDPPPSSCGNLPHTVGSIIQCEDLRSMNVSLTSGVMQTGHRLSKIRQDLNLPSPESAPTASGANTGSGQLVKGGAFVGFINSDQRYYRITFSSGSAYNIEYSNNGSNWSSSSYTGNTSADSVFPDAKCFVLKNWWSGSPHVGDVFSFSVNATTNTLGMPVLFTGGYALSNNVVNCLIDGKTVVVADHHGPEGISYADTEAQSILGSEYSGNILRDYTWAMFSKAGFLNIIRTDERLYHNGVGSVHCGTNVEREIPGYKWWKME